MPISKFYSTRKKFMGEIKNNFGLKKNSRFPPRKCGEISPGKFFYRDLPK